MSGVSNQPLERMRQSSPQGFLRRGSRVMWTPLSESVLTHYLRQPSNPVESQLFWPLLSPRCEHSTSEGRRQLLRAAQPVRGNPRI